MVFGFIGHEWPAIVAGLVVSLAGIPYAVLVIHGTINSARRSILLQQTGMAAVARITAVTPAMDEDMGVILELMVEGPDVQAFVGQVRSEAHDDLVVGACLPALIGREQDFYMIESPDVRSAPFYL